MNPKYPIYIISKGRSEKRLTINSLEDMNVPYRVVIEPQEYEAYAKYVDEKKILVLPFSNLGLGSIPARNWVWEHSKKEGHERHWILDDNIDRFYRLNKNKRIRVTSGTIFRCAEEFVERYTNIAKAGFNYTMFAVPTEKMPPYYLNTRVYSCILLKNDVPQRWRGKYNEDTDLSLRLLKAGYCTILFNAFLANKIATMRMKGGNTEHVYIDGDNRFKFAKSLKEQHPDVVRIVWRYKRWHHQVDYRPFRKNKLILKENLNFSRSINNYGMKLVKIKKEMKKDED